MPYDVDFIEYLRRKQLQDRLDYSRSSDLTTSDQGMPSQMPQVSPIQQTQPFQQPQQNRPMADDLQNYLKEEPKLADYHPGKLRNIFSSILGGIAGAGQGPKVGRDVHSAVQNAPYNRMTNIYQQGLKQRQASAELETKKIKDAEEAEKSRATVSHLISQGKAEEERATAEKARRIQEETKTAAGPKTFEETLQLEAGKHPPKTRALKGPYSVTMKDGSKAEGAMLDPETGLFESPSKGGSPDVIDPKSIAHFATTDKDTLEGTSPFARAFQAWQRENPGKQPSSADITKMHQQFADPGAQSLRIALIGEHEARTTELEGKLSTESDENADYWVKQMQKDPFVFHSEILAKNSNLQNKVARKWSEKTGNSPPEKLPPQEATRLGAANTARDHAKAIMKLIEDPDVQQNIGTIVGKIGELEQWTGGNIRGLPEKVQRKGQMIRQRMMTLLTQEARMASGGRQSNYVLKMIKGVSATPGKALPFVKGALDGVIGGAQVIRNEIYGQYGGGYHPDDAGSSGDSSGEVEWIKDPKTGKLRQK